MGFVPSFDVSAESRNGIARIALAGELDAATVPVLDERMAAFEGDGVSAIMLDLRELTFIDSSGLLAFLQARTRAEANGHRLVLVGASPAVRHLFAATRTETLLGDDEVLSVLDQFTRRNDLGARRAVAAVGDSHV
jgi:anti-sigma B factor antagonist